MTNYKNDNLPILLLDIFSWVTYLQMILYLHQKAKTCWTIWSSGILSNFWGQGFFLCFGAIFLKMLKHIVVSALNSCITWTSLMQYSITYHQIFTFSYTGYALYISGSLLIISITRILGLSFKGIHRRYRLLCAGLWQGYWKFHHHSPFIFHGRVSLHLPLSWKFS